MHFVLLFFLVNILGRVFHEYENHYYIIYNEAQSERMTWTEARDACREEGYELVTVNDEAEHEFLWQFIDP